MLQHPHQELQKVLFSEISFPGDGSFRGGLGNGLRSGDRGPSHSAGLREPPDIGGARGSDRRDVVESDFAEVDFVIEPERVTTAGGEGSRDVMEEEAGVIGPQCSVTSGQEEERLSGPPSLNGSEGEPKVPRPKKRPQLPGAVESCTKDVAEKIQETVEDAAAQV